VIEAQLTPLDPHPIVGRIRVVAVRVVVVRMGQGQLSDVVQHR